MTGTEEERSLEAARYIRENFHPEDRLAVVLVNKRGNAVIQRLAAAEKIAAPDFLTWLHAQNANRYEVYVSMNALHPYAQNRTKDAVATVRHIFLDIDENGSAAVEALRNRLDLPKPNYLISSSPEKWQVVWKVSGFDKPQAEELQRGLARGCGADPAATDCSRVLRLPGFFNHKYAGPYPVHAERIAADTYSRPDFPTIRTEEQLRPGHLANVAAKKASTGGSSQSERDWAYAKRSLARGDPRDIVTAAIADYRRHEKYNPQDYAIRTVARAAAALEAEREFSSARERT